MKKSLIAFILAVGLLCPSAAFARSGGWADFLQEPVDVDKTPPTDTQVLTWDIVQELWIPATPWTGMGYLTPLTGLLLDCSNDPLTASLDIWGNLSVYDAGHSEYIRLYHDGTSANVSSNVGDISLLAPGTNNINLRLGDALGVNKVSIQDSGNNEQASIDSDGNFETVARYYAYSGLSYGAFYHDGADIMLSGSTGDITLMTPSDVNALLSDSAGASYFRVQDSGVNTVASIDSDGNILTTGTLGAGVSTLSTVNFGSSTGVSATAAAGVLTLAGLSGTAENYSLDLSIANLATFSSSTSAIPNISMTDTTTNTVSEVMRLTHSGGAIANGFGSGLDFYLEDATAATIQQASRIGTLWTDATDATRTSAITFSGVTSGGALTEWGRISNSSVKLFDQVTVGNTTDSNSFYVYRKAAEGTNYWKFYIDQYQAAIATSDRPIWYHAGGNDVRLSQNGNFKLFYSLYAAGQNPSFQQNGWIGSPGGGSKYIQWRVEDTNDTFTLTRQDANILATTIQMPLLVNTYDTDGTPATGQLVAKGSTNDGSTNIFVGRDSDEANVATLTTDGYLGLRTAPSYTFHLADTSVSTILAMFQGSGGAGAENQTTIYSDGFGYPLFRMYKAGTETIRLDSGGVTPSYFNSGNGLVIGGTSAMQELTVNGDMTLSDTNPNQVFRVSSDNSAYCFHANADGANDPWGVFQFWYGTDAGTLNAFAVDDVPAWWGDSAKNIHFQGNTSILSDRVNIDNSARAVWVDNLDNVWGVFATGLKKSTDKGNTWTLKDSIAATGADVGKMVFQDSNNYLYWTQWSNSGTALIRRSIDGGENWTTELSFVTTDGGIWGITEDVSGGLYHGYLYAGTYGSVDARIFRSTDSGDTWSAVYTYTPADGNYHIHNVKCDPYTGYVYACVGDGGTADANDRIIRSIDGGANWTVLASGTGYRWIAINFLSGIRIFGDDLSGIIYKTTDDNTFTQVYQAPDHNLFGWTSTKSDDGIVYMGFTSVTSGNIPLIVSSTTGTDWQVVWTGTTGTGASGGGVNFLSNPDSNGLIYISMLDSNNSFRSNLQSAVDTDGNIDSDGIITCNSTNMLVRNLSYEHIGYVIENSDARAGMELETQSATSLGEGIFNIGVNTNRVINDKGVNPAGAWERFDTRAAQLRQSWYYEASGTNTETELMKLKYDTGDFSILTGNLYIEEGNYLYVRSAGNDKSISLIHDDTNATIAVSSGDLYLDPAGNDVILDNATLQIQGAYHLQFRDSAIYINSTDDGYLDLEADTAIRLGADTKVTGNIYCQTSDTNAYVYFRNDTSQWVGSIGNGVEANYYGRGYIQLAYNTSVWGNAGVNEIALNNTTHVAMPQYGAGTATFGAGGVITSTSDERLKDIQGPFNRGLKDLEGISPIFYKWKPKGDWKDDTLYAGFSAQNIQKSIPEAIGQNPEGYLSLQDRPILATLVNAVKELKAENEALKARLDKLEPTTVKGE